MEETLGKRIVASRKRLGLTQDALAERLGVTAQAVSKWENDQSCPDITMLPKLAEVFGITTDALLGLETGQVHEAEIIPEEAGESEPEGLHVQKGNWEFQWDGGRKDSLGLALWILLAGGLMLASSLLQWKVTFWDILWPSGLLVFGLFGLYPRFSVFRLGCSLFGGYYLLANLNLIPFAMNKYLNKGMLLAVFLLLLGLKLLTDALGRPKHGRAHLFHNGKPVGTASKSYCDIGSDSFACATGFAENTYPICLPRLCAGSADVSFGSLTVDLRGCEEIAEGCCVELNCAFGSLDLLIPRSCRAEIESSSSFASVETKGSPDPDAAALIRLECSASFGEITVKYI